MPSMLCNHLYLLWLFDVNKFRTVLMAVFIYRQTICVIAVYDLGNYFSSGTGSTGAAEALAVMGASYFAIMMASALTMKRPHSSYSLAGAKKSKHQVPIVSDVSLSDSMKQPQFYFLGTTFFCLATGGMGMFSVAKPMMNEIFSSVLPAVVTSAFAANFLLLLSAGNLGTDVCVVCGLFVCCYTR